MLRYSLIEPIFNFGGVTTIPLTLTFLYYFPKSTSILIIYLIILYYVTTRINLLKIGYRNWMLGSCKTINYLNESGIRTDRPTVHLYFPHGFFCIAGRLIFAKLYKDNLEYFDNNIWNIFVDTKLYYSSPLTLWSARMTGIIPGQLTHKNVMTVMDRKEEICIFPGDFIEVVGFTDSIECMYIGKVSYYQKMCKRKGYGLRIYMVYDGTRFYNAMSFARMMRITLAKRFNMPFAMSIPNLRALRNPPELWMRHFDVDLDHSLDQVKQEIERIYKSDAKKIEGDHGVKIKSCYIGL